MHKIGYNLKLYGKLWLEPKKIFVPSMPIINSMPVGK